MCICARDKSIKHVPHSIQTYGTRTHAQNEHELLYLPVAAALGSWRTGTAEDSSLRVIITHYKVEYLPIIRLIQ